MFNINLTNQRKLSTICFSLSFAWLLAFPFEGKVLYALVKNTDINAAALSWTAIIAHFIGLITGGFIIKSQPSAKSTLIISMGVCISEIGRAHV